MKNLNKNIFNNRRFKHGSLATVITVGFIVALVLINVVATLLLERFPLTIDLTSDKRFKLTEESVSYIKNLKEEVSITVLADENTFKNNGVYYKQAYEIIKDYSRNSDKITLAFVDITKNPTFANEYPDESLQEADIIVKSEKKDRYKKMSVSSLFTAVQNSYGGVDYSSEAEQHMTSAIMYVTDENPTTVSLLSGLGNINVTGYKSLLESNNYQVISQDIQTEEIDSEAAFVVLPQPKVDLTAEQAEKLDKYLDNNSQYGKSLVFIASPTDEIGPVLKNFLADWGMEIGFGLVAETDTRNAYGDAFTFGVNVVDSDVKGQMKSLQLPVLVGGSRPISLLFDKKDNRTTKIIAQTPDTAVMVPMEAENFDPETAEHKSYATVALTVRQKFINNELKESNLLAIGSADMLSSTLLNYGGDANSDLIMTLSNNLSAKEDTVKILPVDMSQKVINITDSQVNLARMILMIFIPLLVAAAGVVIWLRRRHL